MGGYLPVHEQELLLKAALLTGGKALAAWDEWTASVDINNIDGGSYRLLPLLYRNMSEHGVQHPAIPKLRGVYRQVWYKNQMMLHRTAELLRLLHEAGIPTMILKGTAAVVLYYRDFGLRGMEDVDILVPVSHAADVLRLMPRFDMTEHFPLPRHLPEQFFSIVHSQAYSDTFSHQYDMHWHVFPESGFANADDDLWRDAVPAVLNDVETLALNPADQLLHICTHGLRWNALPPLRWIADAYTLLSVAPPDWTRVVEQARRRELVLPLAESLHYLRTLLDAPIPEDVLNALRHTPVRTRERREYRLRFRSAETPTAVLISLWCKHQRLFSGVNPIRRVAAFPETVRLACRLDSVANLPAHAWCVARYLLSKARQG